MEYGQLINRAFKIAWKYKTLWFFGLFATGGSSYFNLEWDELSGELEGTRNIYGMDIPSLPDELLIPLLLWFGLLGLIFIVMSFISEASLIDSVNRIERGGVYTFSRAFSSGISYFLRFFGLMVLYVMLLLVSVAILVGGIIIGFVVHVAAGIMALLILIPALLFAIFWLGNMLCLTQCSIAVRNNSIGDGIEEALILFKSNFSKVFLITLIYIGLTIVFTIGGLIVWGIFGIPIAAIVLAAGLGTVPAIIAGLIIGLPISLVLGGYLGTFFSGLYTLFYFELLEPGRIMIHAAPTNLPSQPGLPPQSGMPPQPGLPV